MNTASFVRDAARDITPPSATPADTGRRDEERLFRLLLWIAFPLCLVGAAVTRAMPWTGGDGPKQSVIAEAAGNARSAIAIALNS